MAGELRERPDELPAAGRCGGIVKSQFRESEDRSAAESVAND